MHNQQAPLTPEQTLSQLMAIAIPLVEFLVKTEHTLPPEIFAIDAGTYNAEQAERYAREINLMKAVINEYKEARAELVKEPLPEEPYDVKAYKVMNMILSSDFNSLLLHAKAAQTMVSESINEEPKVYAKAIVRIYETLAVLASRIRIAAAPYVQPAPGARQ